MGYEAGLPSQGSATTTVDKVLLKMLIHRWRLEAQELLTKALRPSEDGTVADPFDPVVQAKASLYLEIADEVEGLLNSVPTLVRKLGEDLPFST